MKNQESMTMESSKNQKGAGSGEGKLARCLLIGISVLFLLIMLVFPLVEVIYRSLKEGLKMYGDALTAPNTLSALGVTLIAAVIALAVNTFLGCVLHGLSQNLISVAGSCYPH